MRGERTDNTEPRIRRTGFSFSHREEGEDGPESTRAQSEVIGLVLLFTLSVTAIGVVLFLGQPVIMEASGDAQFERMGNEFSLLDASMSSSVLGAAEGRSVFLNAESGVLESNPDASWMRLEHSSEGKLANITMGNVRYAQDGRTIAYEGGGVWESKVNDDFVSMVSKPEFHYSGSTLTLPAFNVKNSQAVGGSSTSLRVRSTDDPRLAFPNKDLDNPLEEGNVTITVKSEYYRGWESYFRDRTSGAVQAVKDEEKKVVVELDIPTEIDLSDGGGLKWITDWDEQGNTDIEEEEIDSTVDPEKVVDPMVDKCFPNPEDSGCENLENHTGESLDEDKTYYVDVDSGDTHKMGDYAAPDGNVEIVVNGNLAYYNDFAVGDSDADPVEVYVDGDLNLQSNTRINVENPDGAGVDGVTGSGVADVFVTYVTGGVPGDADGGGGAGAGNAEYTGVIYAPNTLHNGGSDPCQGGDKFSGTPTITGAVIADMFCVTGNDLIQADDSLDTLDLSPGVSEIRYLHVTENEVRVSG